MVNRVDFTCKVIVRGCHSDLARERERETETDKTRKGSFVWKPQLVVASRKRINSRAAV